MTNNQDWVERSLRAVWHPCTQMQQHEQTPLIPIQSAKGMFLTDFAGNRYLDMVSSWWVNLFGHGNPSINVALKDQLDCLEHVMLAGFTHAPVVSLSERLIALAPKGLGHCFYASDGASAIEIALKMSFHYWRNHGKTEKTGFISLAQSYHGETLGALSVTDVPLFKQTYAPLLQKTWQVPSPDARLAEEGESAADYALRCADALEILLQKQAGHIAAFILEPLVQGAAGMAMYDPIYLTRAKALCEQYQIHLIADEIAVGFGRTGTLFACEQGAISPDLLCLSKGITGGYLPLAVVMCSETIYQAFYAKETTQGFLHSHSYTGNPLACRAALATLDLFASRNQIIQNQQLATLFNHYLAPIAQHARVRHFRHRGMIWAFDWQGAPASRTIFSAALAQGVLLRPIGHTVYLIPPYIIEEEHMQQVARVLLHLLNTLSC